MLCKVNILNTNTSAINVGANKLTILPPMTVTVLEGRLLRSNTNKYQLPINQVGHKQYVVTNSAMHLLFGSAALDNVILPTIIIISLV